MKRPLLRAALGAAVLLAGSLSSVAQQQSRGHWCATDEHNAALRATFHDAQLTAQRVAADALAERMQNDDMLARAMSPNVVRIIPVVIHVATRCGQTQITKAQIDAGFAQLSRDWQRTSADSVNTRAPFRPYAASLNVEFRLAKIDPQGNATDGINRVTTEYTNSASPRDLIKSAIPAWPNYFNIWLVESIESSGAGGGTILGYGQFPGTGSWNTWGFVMRSDCWTGAFGPNDRTAAHEVGHCFNLYHTFQGGCGSTCSSSGDLVCDTPPTTTATYGCSQSQNTCTNDAGPGSPYTSNVVDQIENYMSYDACQNMFSRGQKTRVEAALQAFPYLQTLISPANLLAAGVADNQPLPPPVPVAYIASCTLGQYAGKISACQGQSIIINDASYGGVAVGSRLWTFTGATPATDTSQNPMIVFNTPGRQTITLTVTGTNGEVSQPVTMEVYVVPSGQALPVQESFETAGIDTVYRVSSSSAVPSVRRWTLVPNGTISTLVASNGQKAFYVPNNSIPAGTVSSLTTPSFDTRNLTAPVRLKFDLAYARRNASSADEMKIYFSTDCGRTWSLQRTLLATTTLPTVSQATSNFIPSLASQWRTDSIQLLNRFLNQSSLLIRFDVTSQASGNNLFLDNLRLAGQVVTGLPADLASVGVALAPNPMTDETSVSFSLPRATQVGLRVTDMLGRVVLTDAETTFQPGDHLLPLATRLQGRAAGVYVVTLTLDGQPITQKLAVQQ